MTYDDWKLMTPEEDIEFNTGRRYHEPEKTSGQVTVRVDITITVSAEDDDDAAHKADEKISDFLGSTMEIDDYDVISSKCEDEFGNRYQEAI